MRWTLDELLSLPNDIYVVLVEELNREYEDTKRERDAQEQKLRQ